MFKPLRIFVLTIAASLAGHAVASSTTVQATGGTPHFNYKDDCYLLSSNGITYIGAGQVVPNKGFSGIVGYANGSGGNGGQAVLAALLGVPGALSNNSYVDCISYTDSRGAYSTEACVTQFAWHSITSVKEWRVSARQCFHAP